MTSPRSLEESNAAMSHSSQWKCRRSVCPRFPIVLGLLTIFSLIMTLVLGKTLGRNFGPESVKLEFKDDNDLGEGEHTTDSAVDYFFGPCLVHTVDTCPDEEITFFLYTRRNPYNGQMIRLNDTWSNLNETNYSPEIPTKIIIHGYNSGMELDSLVDIRNEYMVKESLNLIAVDWYRLAVGPCYPVAVRNVPHVGDCLAQLIERLRDLGTTDIHVIGFSLGAHVPAFAANVLRPYKIPRITGLDPAMPFFVTVGKDRKLDAEDAEFVDVLHTNAFVQGKVETCGHVDFYMNGGINQPGCWRETNPFGCSHHRSAVYFAESINSDTGFWGWPCSGFLANLLGFCPPRLPAILAGNDVNSSDRGFIVVKTRSAKPFAEGPFLVD